MHQSSEPDSPPPAQPRPAFTVLLRAACAGSEAATNELLPLVYEQLRRTAQKYLAQERKDHTLQATALVHEAYARLVGGASIDWRDRAQFYFATAEAMRRILIEHARSRARVKRGGDGQRPMQRVPLEGVDRDASAGLDIDPEQILMLDAALRRLEEEDRQAADVVRLRYYAGLSVAETAAALGVSPSTVDREWAYARARLHRWMQASAG
ncbi:MAG: sigma-70 family RNA polymerase sigma factor [Phycisphaeraceae bacterium]|nr:sigma-70 family RNA polymerase sigma factor [Phycisphaeraceae bacterium]